jgi:hypothetical protein
MVSVEQVGAVGKREGEEMNVKRGKEVREEEKRRDKN